MIKISTNISELGDSNSFNVPVYNDEIQSSYTDPGFLAERLDRMRIRIAPSYPSDVTVNIEDPETVSFIMMSCLLADKSVPALRPVRFSVNIEDAEFGMMSELRMVNLDGFDKTIVISAFENTTDAMLDIIVGYKS